MARSFGGTKIISQNYGSIWFFQAWLPHWIRIFRPYIGIESLRNHWTDHITQNPLKRFFKLHSHHGDGEHRNLSLGFYCCESISIRVIQHELPGYRLLRQQQRIGVPYLCSFRSFWTERQCKNNHKVKPSKSLKC